MEIRAIGIDDVGQVQELIESDAGYTERITGYPPGAADAQSLLMGRPEGVAEDAKVVLGVFDGARLVAVADLLRGYPVEGKAFIGLLEMHGEYQGRGVGRAAYGLVERYVGDSWPEVRTLRLAVVDTNAEVAEGFWRRQGFEPTGEEKTYQYDKLVSTVRLYEKKVG
ncbi:acetyltransferase (GNAT) family protein [Kribbella sp. VKM Ac-2527]|uniref:Acetyltransferase (GNAT) family protein n=1 Tax=Kribbella caucasensis TaxID=2512215 RepID=A0A4R6JIC0_9ACTN|nr:GNAT family N-acetyltransferase [Kribbella sp. VKM Ac-2527]TDO35874.1 acetyltransferase (GNAT) family protein [Kribbella sp. VKM Ac-2527]